MLGRRMERSRDVNGDFLPRPKRRRIAVTGTGSDLTDFPLEAQGSQSLTKLETMAEVVEFIKSLALEE